MEYEWLCAYVNEDSLKIIINIVLVLFIFAFIRNRGFVVRNVREQRKNILRILQEGSQQILLNIKNMCYLLGLGHWEIKFSVRVFDI